MLALKKTCVFAAVFLVAGALEAADGGADGGPTADGGATADGSGCTSSATCAAPTPYCHPIAHRCVECLGPRNCADGKVCDTTTGECRGCLVEGDCSPDAPYCTATGACVECTNDNQCNAHGIECLEGKCGRCGDGICSRKEGLNRGEACAEDCASFCPSKDIGSGLGRFTVQATMPLRNLFAPSCPASTDGVEASFIWRAPQTGMYRFTGFSGEISAGVPFFTSNPCADLFSGRNCASVRTNDAGESIGYIDLQVARDRAALIIVDTGLTRAESVTIEIACSPPGCPDGGPGTGSDQGAVACMNHAKKRGEPACAGLECACRHCPQDYEDCGTIPGCQDIALCMTEHDCIAEACNVAGACKNLIAGYGGTSARAFDIATRLQSCELSFSCSAPCATDGGPNGGAHRDAATDSGPHCRGSACDASTSGPDAAVVPMTPAAAAGGGCDCRISRPSIDGWDVRSGAALCLAVALSALARRKRRSGSGSGSHPEERIR